MCADRGHALPAVADLPLRSSRAEPHSHSPVPLARLGAAQRGAAEAPCLFSPLMQLFLATRLRPPSLLFVAPVGSLPQKTARPNASEWLPAPPSQNEASANRDQH